MKNGDVLVCRRFLHSDSLQEGERLTEWNNAPHHTPFSKGIAVTLIRSEAEKPRRGHNSSNSSKGKEGRGR